MGGGGCEEFILFVLQSALGAGLTMLEGWIVALFRFLLEAKAVPLVRVSARDMI